MDDLEPEPELWTDQMLSRGESFYPRVVWAEGVEVNVSVVRRRPSDLWRLKEAMWEQEQGARAFWAQMSEDERLAAAELITAALRRLIDDPLVWLPSTITPVEGDRLDVTLSLILPPATDSAVRRLAKGARAREDMLTSLQALRDSLGEDEEPTG